MVAALYASRTPDLDAPSLYKVGTTKPAINGSSIFLKTLLEKAALDEGTIHTLRYGTDSNATMTTELDDDNDITYTAKTPGTTGNLIGVEYVLPSLANSPLSVSVAEAERTVGDETLTGYTVTVSIATDSEGAADTDAETLAAYIEITEAAFYVRAALADGVNGAGQLSAMSEKLLTGGTGSGEYQTMERISARQREAARLNPKLLASRDGAGFYYFNGALASARTGEGSKLELILPPPFNTNSTIEYCLIGWSDVLITPTLNIDGIDTSDISTAFSPMFLDNAITTASALLLREIQT